MSKNAESVTLRSVDGDLVAQVNNVNADVIRTTLQRILNSSDFDASERNRRFLVYIVEETLADRAERIKAYNIATAVFGRPKGFDPQIDPIVRIEARRLRRSLERYYLTSGLSDTIHIDIPKGAYVPAFTHEGQPDSSRPGKRGVSGRPGTARRSPSIYVAPLNVTDAQSGCANLAPTLTRQIIVGLTRFIDLFVFGPETSRKFGSSVSREALLDELRIDLILTGGIIISPNDFSLEVDLLDACTGRYIWAESYERELNSRNITKVCNELAEQVARTLGQPYGVIFSHRARDVDGNPPVKLQSYDAVVKFYNYWRSYDPELFEETRKSLEATLAADPEYAEAYACLSQIYTDAFRFDFGSLGEVDPIERALQLAHRAIELAPSSSRGYHALAQAYWFSRDVNGSLSAFKTGLELNPNDSNILADLGHHYALRADWEKAVPLLRESYACNPAQPNTYRIGLSVNHYVHGHFEEALAEAKK